MRWNTFDQYKRRAFNVWCVKMPKDTSKWYASKCNCPSFFKKYICKHVVGLAIRLKYTKPPPAARDVPIGAKRKPGRPKKATKALLIN